MATSFATDILPLFRAVDISHMKPMGVALDDYSYMADPAGNSDFPDHANGRTVFAYLTGAMTPRMPPGGPFWSSGQLQVYQQWMDDGFQP
jgi:hypothetical protein